jgi:hypothetical protein
MIAPGVFVIISVLPFISNVTPPTTIDAPLGLESAGEADAANAAPTASVATRCRDGNRSNIDPRRLRACDLIPPEPRTAFPRTPAIANGTFSFVGSHAHPARRMDD